MKKFGYVTETESDMSADAPNDPACPKEKADEEGSKDGAAAVERAAQETVECAKKAKTLRKVCFPTDDVQLVTHYFEPANPWQDVPPTTRELIVEEYLKSCRKHDTPPLDCVVQQIRELPDASIGGGSRAPRLVLSAVCLVGCRAVDALEPLLSRVQFTSVLLQDVALDDEGAEALFDMVEYYESATVLSISGPRDFGIRGWQAASRMVKKSAELSELEISDAPLMPCHAPVLARALRVLPCRLGALSLHGAALHGEPLAILVIALKSNTSVRELRLGDNSLTPSDALQISSLLKLNCTIQLLDLSNNQIQDQGVSHIADALLHQATQTPPSANTSPLSPHQYSLAGYEGRGLAYLVLWNNQLTRNCAVYLSKAVHSSPTLCVLNIGRNAIGAETIAALNNAGNLASLGLQAARLTCEAAHNVAQMISTTRLQRLDLRDNKLGCAGLQSILNAVKENTSLTQIDLDDPTESTTTLTAESGGEAATCARLTKEIRAICRRNERDSTTAQRVHRKISLTCARVICAASMQSCDEDRRKFRSPLPSPVVSPAGSPIPEGKPNSRFSVTRVTPDRDSSTDSSTASTPTRPSPSRFKVMQVAEPPRILVQAADSTPRRPSSSRFSVSRNYDTMYNPKAPEVVVIKTSESDPNLVNMDKGSDVKLRKVKTSESVNRCDDKSDKPAVEINKTVESDDCLNETINKTDVLVRVPEYKDKTEQFSHNQTIRDNGDDKVLVEETKIVKNTTEVSNNETVDVKVEMTVKKECVTQCEENIDRLEDVHIVNKAAPAKVHSDQMNTVSTVVEHVNKSADEYRNIDEFNVKDHKEKRDDIAIKQITAIAEDLGNIIKEFKDLSTKTAMLTRKPTKEAIDIRNDCTQTDQVITVDLSSQHIISKDDNCVPGSISDSIVLKKNKSESSLDSPDLEVSRLMNKKMISPFCDSSSSLEISGSSMESLDNLHSLPKTKPIIIQESVESDLELDRRKSDHALLSTESSIESNTSEVTPVNCRNFLNMSISSNESVSPIIFGKNKKIHGSLSSLEASMSSLDSAKGTERIMVTSADSGIEYSLQNASDNKEDTSSNEGTLTNNSSLKETVNQPDSLPPCVQETLTPLPKRTSSMLDVPALKNKGLDPTRNISWVAPSSSFHIPKPEPEIPKQESKLPSHLEKLLSLFQHPTSLFRSNSQNDDEKKSASNTPPRKESSSLSNTFWSWGVLEKGADLEKTLSEDRDSLSEDSTLSERLQVSFVDESLSKKYDSKSSSTDTDNTLSEFQSFPIQGNSENSDNLQATFENKEENSVTEVKVTEALTTDDNLVQKHVDIRLNTEVSSNGNVVKPGAVSDITDLSKPNDLNKNVYDTQKAPSCDQASEPESLAAKSDKTNNSKPEATVSELKVDENKPLDARPRSFAAVLKSSGSENTLDKQTSPETGQPVDKLPIKIIRGIKENISPENTLTPSNTKALALELTEKQVKNQPIINALWEVSIFDKSETVTTEETSEISVIDDVMKTEIPIAMYDQAISIDHKTVIEYIDEKKTKHDQIKTVDSSMTSMEVAAEDKAPIKEEIVFKNTDACDNNSTENLDNVDLAKDALSYLMYENQDFEPDTETVADNELKTEKGIVLAQELKEAELKALMIDLSPELVEDDAADQDVFTSKEIKSRTSPIIPERAKLKKSNSLEELTQRLETTLSMDLTKHKTKPKNIVFKVPESTSPRDIPERRQKLRSRSGSSPKSLPDTLNKPFTKFDSSVCKKKKKVSSLGKIARDSLLALNLSEEEIAECRRSYKITSVESLRSLESVSEDANSQSGNSADSRCRICLRMSQESLMSLDSITEDCKCDANKGESSHSTR